MLWILVVCCCMIQCFPKHIVKNIKTKQSISGTLLTQRIPACWLLSLYQYSPKNNISSCISPILCLSPLSTLSHTCVLLFGVPLQYIMIGCGVIPFSPNQQQYHCRWRIVFNCSILLCLSPSQWQWHDCNGGAANDISCMTREQLWWLIVVFALIPNWYPTYDDAR